MTALLELKQKIKEFYSEHDVLLLSVGKFLLAFLLFQGINSSMGMMEKIDNIFVVLILAIVCAILPVNTMAVIGCLLIVAHCYAVGIEGRICSCLSHTFDYFIFKIHSPG